MTTPRAAPPIALNVVSKRYATADGQGVEALRDCAFTLAPGGFACIIGPSGCGKSTALRILMGLDRAFDGDVSLPPGRDGGPARLGVMFQEPRLLPWRTLEANVRLALPDALARRDLGPLFAELGLSEMAGRFPGELSGGLARRAALARALAVEPDILLLDEPFVSLDAMTAARLRTLLAEVIAPRQISVIMVTHDVREALDLASELILFTPRPGRVLGIEPLGRPRAERDPAWIEARLADLARRYPGTVRG